MRDEQYRCAMEAFESFVALALETEELVVSEALKFPVAQQTTSGKQTHGYEVDLVGARSDRLVLATVKSFFGSHGVAADHVAGTAKREAYNKRYALLNNPHVRDTVVKLAAERFGYQAQQIEMRLYVGKFAGAKTGEHRRRIETWCAQQQVGSCPIQVIGVEDVVNRVRQVAQTNQYRDSAALVTMKLLDAAGVLTFDVPNQ